MEHQEQDPRQLWDQKREAQKREHPEYYSEYNTPPPKNRVKTFAAMNGSGGGGPANRPYLNKEGFHVCPDPCECLPDVN
jgi:hypothetical protein